MVIHKFFNESRKGFNGYLGVGYKKFNEIIEAFAESKLTDGKTVWVDLEPVRLRIALKSVKG